MKIKIEQDTFVDEIKMLRRITTTHSLRVKTEVTDVNLEKLSSKIAELNTLAGKSAKVTIYQDDGDVLVIEATTSKNEKLNFDEQKKIREQIETRTKRIRENSDIFQRVRDRSIQKQIETLQAALSDVGEQA